MFGHAVKRGWITLSPETLVCLADSTPFTSLGPHFKRGSVEALGLPAEQEQV